jgi:hypothetical protein
LSTRYDYSFDKVMREMDDCNLRFVDTSALKRFMGKCRIYPSDDLLIAVVRRLDIDADGRLSKCEFKDGIMPMENFTKNSVIQFKKVLDS